MHIAAKMGRVRSQTLERASEGRARSERRSIRGPELGLGAAMRVRRAFRREVRRSCRRGAALTLGRSIIVGTGYGSQWEYRLRLMNRSAIETSRSHLHCPFGNAKT